MRRAEDTTNRPSGQFLHRPSVDHHVFHIHQSRPFPVDSGLLTSKELKPVQEIIQYTDRISSQIRRTPAEIVALGRMGAFVDNYVKTVLEGREGFSPVVLACGDSGALNAFFNAGSIDVKKGVVPLMKEEAIALVKAKERLAGGMFQAQISPLTDRLTRKEVLENLQNLRRQGFYVSDELRNIVYIGASRPGRESNLDYISTANPKARILEIDGEAPLHTPLMEPYLNELKKTLEQVDFKAPRVPIIGSDGNQIRSVEDMKREIIREVIRPVDLSAIEGRLAAEWGIQELHHLGLDKVEEDGQRIGISAIAVGGGIVAGTILGVFIYKKFIKGRGSKKA